MTGPLTPEQQLRKAALRVTRPRVAVLTQGTAYGFLRETAAI